MKFNLHEDKRGDSSLAFVKDLHEWWQAYGPEIAEHHGKAGWILFLLDSLEKLEELEVTLSRVIRNKPQYDTASWNEKEWLNTADVAAEPLAWFRRHCDGPFRESPDWAKFLFQGLHDGLCVLSRLGKEVRTIQEQGYYVATLERGEKISMGGDSEAILAEMD